MEELIDLIAEQQGRPPAVDFGPWLRGNQRYFASDTTAFTAATGRRSRMPPRE